MASPYAQDLRDRVLAAYDRGMQTKAIGNTFSVSPSWANKRLGVDGCSESAVGMALIRLGLSLKKRRSMPPSRTGPTSLKSAVTGRQSNRRIRRDV
jgi:transposase